MTGLQRFLAGLATLAALIAAGVIGVAGVGHKYGVWDYADARQLLTWGVYGCAAAGALALVALALGLARGRLAGAFTALFALAAAGGAAYAPLNLHRLMEASPPLNDVTTDFTDPPAYIALAAVRALTPVGLAYDGAKAPLQRERYPAVSGLDSAASPGALYAGALAAAKAQGWVIAAEAPEQGRIEATAVSEWLGLKEDIVIRIRPTDAGSRLDMRSASRAGENDMGANAAHIRAIVNALPR